MSIETRFAPSALEVRSNGRGIVIKGRAPSYGVRSQDLGGWAEEIDPSALDEFLAGNPTVMAYWNHDRNMPLACTDNGSLRLRNMPDGLHFEIDDPSDTSYGRDLVANVRSGRVGGSSFGFRCARGGDEWRSEGRVRIRTIRKIGRLLDVSPTCEGAYPDSDCSVAYRSMDAWVQNGSPIYVPQRPSQSDLIGRSFAALAQVIR